MGTEWYASFSGNQSPRPITIPMLRDHNRSVKVRGTVDAVDTEDKSASSPTFSEDWPRQSAQMRFGGAQQNDKTTITGITSISATMIGCGVSAHSGR
jgi:hypothetical protein